MTDYDRHNAEIERLHHENKYLLDRIELMELALIVAATSIPRNTCTAWSNWQNGDFIRYFMDTAKKMSKRHQDKLHCVNWPGGDQ